MNENILYFDNAATSWPKPEDAIAAMIKYNKYICSSPGRSGHRLSIEAARVVIDARDYLAELFNVKDPLQIVFTKNATEALNIATFGLLKPTDHVITSSMEHNSVMRPLRFMESSGLELTIIRCSEKGEISPDEIVKAIKKNTRLVIMTHASNVTGTIFPLYEIGEITRAHNLIFCVDAAQTAGSIPIDVDEMNIDLLAFTGHKSLFGPQGTGGLYIRKGLEADLRPLVMGGTGSKTEFEEQPDFMPDKYESGTPNSIGIAGLCASVEYILSRGVDEIRMKEEKLTGIFLDGLTCLKGISIYGTLDKSKQTPVVSFNIDGMSSSEASMRFDESFCIMSRPGLHCSPSAHKTIGTFPQGTIRFSFGYFNTEEQVYIALKSIKELCSTG